MMGIAADFGFFKANSQSVANVQTAVAAAVAAANLVFQAQMNVQLVIADQLVMTVRGGSARLVALKICVRVVSDVFYGAVRVEPRSQLYALVSFRAVSAHRMLHETSQSGLGLISYADASVDLMKFRVSSKPSVQGVWHLFTDCYPPPVSNRPSGRWPHPRLAGVLRALWALRKWTCSVGKMATLDSPLWTRPSG
jgi:hypothetical protein